MSIQKQREQHKPSTGGSGQSGNHAAKTVADNANAVLARTAERTDAERILDIRSYLANAVSEPDVLGINKGGEVCLTKINGTPQDILACMKKGTIDERTMQWTDKAQGGWGRICFCLVPSCRIGPFVPIRKR